MTWDNTVLENIKDVKKKILKNKVMLNFLIDIYGKYDKYYKWGHIATALLSPLFGFINVASETNSSLNVLIVVFGCISTGLIKARDYIDYDKIKEASKRQTVLYTQLFDRIEREIDKPINRRQDSVEFLYWINREYTNIQINDPELTHSDKKKFIQMCKENGIVFDEDLDDLKKLVRTNSNSFKDEVKDEKSNEIKEEKSNEIKNEIKVVKDEVKEVKLIKKETKIDIPPKILTINEDNSATDIQPPTIHRVLAISNISPTSLNRNRNLSDEKDRSQYKDTLKKLDPKADMTWTMDRMRQLDEN